MTRTSITIMWIPPEYCNGSPVEAYEVRRFLPENPTPEQLEEIEKPDKFFPHLGNSTRYRIGMCGWVDFVLKLLFLLSHSLPLISKTLVLTHATLLHIFSILFFNDCIRKMEKRITPRSSSENYCPPRGSRSEPRMQWGGAPLVSYHQCSRVEIP
jgi:hypothetical protein